MDGQTRTFFKRCFYSTSGWLSVHFKNEPGANLINAVNIDRYLFLHLLSMEEKLYPVREGHVGKCFELTDFGGICGDRNLV